MPADLDGFGPPTDQSAAGISVCVCSGHTRHLPTELKRELFTTPPLTTL